MRYILALICLTAPALAEPMTAAEFEAWSTGRVLDFTMNGERYGTEYYMPGRRVKWAFTGEDCVNGFWYEREPREICFIYSGDLTPECWHYHKTEDGIIAEYLNEPDANEYAGVTASEGMACFGPNVGV